MGIEFYNTMMGKKFYEGTMPRIASSLEKLTELLAKQGAPEELAEWVLVSPHEDMESTYECSICGETVEEWSVEDFAYCPHCGRKIRRRDA